MSREVTREEVKGLFSALVSRCGGVTACGAKLGITHQRVSQLQTLDRPDDMPTILQIAALEAWCGEPVVTSALARAADGEEVGDLLVEAMEAIEAAGRLLSVVRTDGGDKKKALAAALETRREVDEVIAVLSRGEGASLRAV